MQNAERRGAERTFSTQGGTGGTGECAQRLGVNETFIVHYWKHIKFSSQHELELSYLTTPLTIYDTVIDPFMPAPW